VTGLTPSVPMVRSWWLSPAGLLLIAALASGALAWWLIAFPVVTLANAGSHPQHFPMVFAHMAGGTLMLFVGAANLYVGATRRHFAHHKTLGYLYLTGGAVGATLALILALRSPHGSTGTGDIGYALAALALAWMVCATMAWRAARNRRYDSHRAWMVRSYVLTWSFVLCRLIAKVPALAGLGDGSAIIWLSWVVPLFACEVALQWSAGSSERRGDLRG
jgi:Predicted membrane protein (DUF2306)